MARIHALDPDELVSDESRHTSGMHRRGAMLGEDVHAVTVRTEPGMVSGWHHHGDHDTYGWVVSGRLRLEGGPDGTEVVDVGPGGFFHVPANTVHREGNPGDEEQVLIGVRTGRGPTVINVDGPPEG